NQRRHFRRDAARDRQNVFDERFVRPAFEHGLHALAVALRLALLFRGGRGRAARAGVTRGRHRGFRDARAFVLIVLVVPFIVLVLIVIAVLVIGEFVVGLRRRTLF